MIHGFWNELRCCYYKCFYISCAEGNITGNGEKKIKRDKDRGEGRGIYIFIKDCPGENTQ